MFGVITIFIIFLALWFLGIGAVAYHVLKYSSPGDKLIISFFAFFGIAGISFFWVISYVLGGV